MIINCPGCGERYELDSKYIGETLACESCNKEFEVKNTNLIPCPDCFSLISKRATTCPHCGVDLREALVNDFVQLSESKEIEKNILFCHPSALNYLAYYVLLILLGVLAIITLLFGALLFFMLIFLFAVLLLISVVIEIQHTTYNVTNQRIIVSRGWIGKRQTEIWIKDMRGVHFSQGIWQRIIGVGNIAIGTAATAGTEIVMVGINNPQKVVETINSLRQ